MTTEIPIACSLSADELPKRLEEMSAIGRDALLGVTPKALCASVTTRRRAHASKPSSLPSRSAAPSCALS